MLCKMPQRLHSISRLVPGRFSLNIAGQWGFNNWEGIRMSFVHYLYIGHFEREGNFVRFANTPTDPILKPIMSHSLDTDAVKRLVQESGMVSKAGNSLFPVGWAIWAENGYLGCDQCELNQEAIDFIIRLAQ